MNWKSLRYDQKLLRGDPMLILSLSVPFILTAIMLLVIPPVRQAVMHAWDYDIGIWYRHAGYFFTILIPMMTGMVYGFILLDERDEGVLTAIAVTPPGKRGYLLMRLGIPMILAFLFVLLFQYITGITGTSGLLQILALSVVMASQSLMLLLFLGAFAGNKIVGLAISKGFGILLLGPLLDYILPPSLKWIGAYSPMFWTGRCFMAEDAASYLLYLLPSILIHALLIAWLYRKFIRRAD